MNAYGRIPGPELLVLHPALFICDRTHNSGYAAKQAIAPDEVYGKTGSSSACN
jgi:hypothetical protein